MMASPVILGASPSPAAGPSVWVLTPLGLNVHSQPGATAPVAGAAPQGTGLLVAHTRKVGADTWLQVTSQDSSVSGWVLDRPDLLIHQEVEFHIDSDQSWSMLLPPAWNVQQAGSPTGVTTLTGGGLTMTFDVEADAPAFKPPGSDLQDQQIEVYGKTTVLSTYRLPDGSYEFVARAKWDTTQPVRYFTISYHEPAGAPADASLCLQLIDSIKIT